MYRRFALTALAATHTATAARARTLTACLHWALALLLALLPFELTAGLTIARLTFTNVELAALAALGLWAALLALGRRAPRVPVGLAVWAGLLLLALLASGALAGEWRGAALKFGARQIQGALLGLCLADQLMAHGWRLARRLGLALIAGAALSALAGLAEFSELPPLMAVLGLFKEQPTMAGGMLRLSGTFAYANIAAMFYEAVLPIALVAASLVRRRGLAALLALATVVLYLAALLTFSRAALLAASLAVAIVAVVAALLARASAADRRPARRALGLSAGLGLLLAGLLLLSPAFRVRIAEPDVDRWYRAEYAAAPVASLAPNQLVTTPVTVRNQGLVTWRIDGMRPIRLAYHWLDARTRLVVRYNGHRTALPAPLGPGESAQLDASVQAPPQPGDYLLVWDMVSEGSGWFSERGNPVAEQLVRVAGAPSPERAALAAEPPGLPQRLEVHPPPPPRGQLWRAAIRLWRDRPLLGIGPDVFRHVYGPVLGLATWDDRIHTNNLYLELLVGAGVAGLAAFLGLVVAASWPALRALARLVRAAPASDPARLAAWALAGCGAALAAFLLHGLLDMFLEYSATYMLMWLVLGALAGLAGAAQMSERE